MPGRVSRGGVRSLKRVPLPALFCADVKGWGLANSARCNRPCGRVYRGAAGGARGAHGENNTSPVSGCFSVGGNRPCGSVESGACRPRAALFGEQGFHADAVLGRSNRAAEGYGRVNGRGPPRQGHRCRDDVHLRLRRRGRRTERRGLLCAEKAVLLGIAPPEVRPAVMKNLEDTILTKNTGHFDSGMHGTYFLIKELMEADRNDLIYQMTEKEDFPSWGNMLKLGATTSWESWSGGSSHIHDTLISIGAWFIEGIGGIRGTSRRPGSAISS